MKNILFFNNMPIGNRELPDLNWLAIWLYQNTVYTVSLLIKKKKTDQLKLIVDLVLHSCLKFKFISFIMIMLTFTMENRVQQ